jgi:hypothetical protein
LIIAKYSASSISAVFKTRTSSIIYVNYREMREGPNWAKTFDCHWTSLKPTEMLDMTSGGV